MDKNKAEAYWKANISLIGILLGIWAFVSYGMGLIGSALLSGVYIPGFQIDIPFWFAQQGSMITFVILIWVYATQMDKVDAEHDVHE